MTAPENPYMIRDPQAFLHNMAHMVEEAGHAAAAWVGPRETGETKDDLPESIAELSTTLGKVSEYWLSDPQRALQAQTALFSRYMDLWSSSIRRMAGEKVEDVAKPEPGDRRFNDREWQENQFFNFLRQAYLITSGWVADLVQKTEGLDEHTKHKAVFYAQQLINSLVALEFSRDQPGSAARNVQERRREPGARHAHAGRGPGARQGRTAAAAGRQYRHSRWAATSPTRPARWLRRTTCARSSSTRRRPTRC